MIFMKYPLYEKNWGWEKMNEYIDFNKIFLLEKEATEDVFWNDPSETSENHQTCKLFQLGKVKLAEENPKSRSKSNELNHVEF